MLTTPRKLALTVFLVMALHASPSGVQNGRYIASVASLVETGQFAIADRFPDDTDFVRIANTRYPNMPPGMTLLLTPHYWVYSHLVGGHISTASSWHAALFGIFVSVTLTAPILALTAVLLFRLCLSLSSTPATAVWVTLGIVLGTPIFTYGTQLWSHDFSAALVVGITYLIVTRRPAWAIGALMGCLLLLENHAPLSLAMLGSFWLWSRWRARVTAGAVGAELLWLVLAFAPFAAGLLLYNRALTGSMFQNAASVWFAENIPGQPVFAWPDVTRLWGLTFSPYRGIFLYAPLTLLAVIGLVGGRSPRDPLARFAWVFAAGYFALSVTFVQWENGVAFGPRYFTSAFPLLLTTVTLWPTATVRNWALLSIVINWAGATTPPAINLGTNLMIFAYRGPFLAWLDFVHHEVLPACCRLDLYTVTSFWPEVGLGLVLWGIWRLPAWRLDVATGRLD